MRKSTLIKKKIMISLLMLIASLLFIPTITDAAPNDPVFVSVTSEEATTFALDQEGQIWAWGENGNQYGQYGDGTTVSSALPKKVQVMNGGTPVRFTKANPAANHSIALDNNGNIWTTGHDSDGQLGNGPLGDSLTWTRINIPGRTFVDIAATVNASFALDSNGSLWGWGYETTLTPQVPVQVPVEKDGTAYKLKSLYGHDQAVMAIDTDDQVWYIREEGRYLPQRYWTMAGVRFKSVSIGSGSSGAGPFVLALDTYGNVWGWGDNSRGQLGHGLSPNFSYNPIPIPIKNGSNPIEFAQISAGYSHTLGLDVNGKMWVWGVNEQGQLGDGTTSDTSYAKTYTVSSFEDGVLRMVGFRSVEGGLDRSYALDLEGKLWHWGNGVLKPAKLGLAVSATKEITAFSFASPAVTGTVNEAGRTISITVPYGTNIASLTPTITHTGASISPNSGAAQNFTNPVTYTVSAADGSTKSYTVTVNVAASPAKAITAFGFASPAVAGTINEAAGTITVHVPYGTNVTSLTPTITHTGASISPTSGMARNFTNPVTYTVTAADGSIKSYTVTVNVAASPAKAITAFGFASPAVAGTINEAAGTITVHVPYGTNVTSLIPTITHTGASISPTSGTARNFTNPVTYTVTAADGSTKSYTVTVNVAASPAKAITAFGFASPAVAGTINEAAGTITVQVPYGTNVASLTPTIVHTGASISPNSGSAQNFTNPVTYTVRAADGSMKSYTVTVNVAASPAKSISVFSFASPAVVGTINEAAGTITVHVPYGTNVASLTPTITHTGASISPNSGAAQNFTNPVTYTVRAADGSMKSYTVTVNVAASPAKAITAFGFVSPAVVGTINEAAGTITVHVPYGTDITALTPTITHTGASISPTSGTARNFTNPVTYTVTAADGSKKSYTVTVNVAASPAKAITVFSFASPAVAGTINETAGTITVHVPYGTNVTSLTPTITHIGASISPNSGTAQNFTNPVSYTVTAADGSKKSYTVTVNVAASPAKAITAFSFTTPAVSGTVNEAAGTITVHVLYGTDVTALTPTITHTGASISPNSGTAQNFTNPVTYTVTAADGSNKSYTVTVNVAANPAKAITAFSFTTLSVAGTINEAAGTITVHVPYGTNVASLTPTITHTGASISPTSGTARNFTNPVTYTVTAADGSIKSYTVTVNVAASPAKAITAFSFTTPAVAGTVNEASRTIAVTVPYGTDVTALTPTITHTGASISPNSGTARNFTNPVTYTVTAADGSIKSYTVTVNVATNPAKAITEFSLTTPSVAGAINEAAGTITVHVPYGTDVTALTPTITHTGASISPNSGTAQNFTNPVSYTVTAADGSKKSYTVTVNVAASPAKAITEFSFMTPSVAGAINEAAGTITVLVPYGTDVTALTPTITHTGASISPISEVVQDFINPVTYTVTASDGSTQNYTVTVSVAASSTKAITAFSFTTPAAVGTVNEANHTIAITVPYGTDVTALAPTITHTGASISPNSEVAQNFTNPVTYTVTASDGSTQNYTVTVSVAASSTKAITAFSFTTPAAGGTVNEANHTIAITVPYGTDVTALAPTITHTGASISPNSEVAQDFTNPVTYTVTASDGSTQNYTVTVSVAASPAKAITAFSFTTPAAVGTVNEANHTIAITVPYGTDVTALAPTITHTGASISPTSEVVQDFTNPVTYTVTASDGTTQSYTVTANVAANSGKAITAFSFTTPAAVGTVNEANHTIDITVPYGTDVTALAPTITHTGASTSPISEVAQDFTNPVTYTVTASDGSTQNYVVTVNVVPASVHQLTADRADGQVNLNWGTVKGATYYKVYVSTVQGLFDEPVAVSVTDATYNMMGLMNGTTYYFIVKAGNAGGLSEASNEASATPGTVPDAPTNVIAVAGNGQATVSFTPPANDGGYAITSYEVTDSSGGIVRSGSSSPITMTGLTPGISYTFTVKAINEVGKSMASTASNAVIPSSPTGGGNGSSNNNSETAASLADVFLNHEVVDAGAQTTVDHGNKMLTIIVDRNKLVNRLAAVEQGALITYRVNSSFDRVVAEMDVPLVRSMAAKQAVITFETDKAKYVLPVQQINLEALVSLFGESVAQQDIKLKVEINTRGAEDTANTIKDAVSQGMFTLLVPPIEFNIQATYGETTVELSKFNTFLEHWIAIPDNVNPDSVTAAVAVEPNGMFRTVPIQVVEIENQHFVKVRSLNNGTFAIVSHAAKFNDVTGHWAEQAIRDMGERMIVEGAGNLFEPDREITRAEFAAILVRGLGLPMENGAAPFSDILQSAWYNDVVNTIYTYRLITGFEDGTFNPNDRISREQAMVMLSRVMTLTGLKAKRTGQAADEILLPYTDAASASKWALGGIADCIQSGVIMGKSGAKLAPQDFVTRAEAATIVQRLLQLSNLI
ncbi:DUF5018 domain-containing protein [Paenibacillus sp. 1011MAR3C5]|uniref:DUF5018 domain-containing protein n=1 Tax=Paenibacillus sp. 1011MAR3C5 TaxID=1675787 RepID=UPI000E6CB32F|nr:DUF5018 domain-containing protein [Paenibacillus sp. 1011MAR3C5]RJE88734.1 DUF5018 domain-containing protein [Paenibacillus sp. 1011MAR3C5]